MKTMKKIISMLLACVTVLSMSVVSFACIKHDPPEDTTPPTDTNEDEEEPIIYKGKEYDLALPYNVILDFDDTMGEKILSVKLKGTFYSQTDLHRATFGHTKAKIVENNSDLEFVIIKDDYLNDGVMPKLEYTVKSTSGGYKGTIKLEGHYTGIVNYTKTKLF